MSLELELAFEPPGEHVQEAGALVYRLYEIDDHYVLPNVVLRSAPGAQRVNVREVSVTSVSPNSGSYAGLSAAISTAWNRAADGGWVVGRLNLVSDTTLPGGVVDPALDASAGHPAEMIVGWHYVYIASTGAESAYDARVRLLFQPRGVRPATPASDPAGAPAHLPGQVRSRGTQQYNGFAAVDFGTSSSAVAVYDARHVVPRSIDLGQAARLRRELAQLLRSAPEDRALAEPWQAELASIVSAVDVKLPEYGFRDIEGLAAELDSVAAAGRSARTTDPVLDTVCLALEQRVAECQSPELARWLAPRLLSSLHDAFITPDLDEQQILEVVFDPDKGLREIGSAFKVTERHPVKIELGAEREAEDISLRLKAEMFDGTPVPDATGWDGREATTADLVVNVYYQLAIWTEEFLRIDKETSAQPLVHLVATYPTTTLPSDRKRLEQWLTYCLGMDQVVTDFDEGVAAGLFFLMRDFSSKRLEFGAEALRARARRVSADPPEWQQTMLIIDIGAGTSDIALIGLTLRDITRGDGDHLARGRHYLIRPEVLNSTGHRQLGGNYLTLRVFYWLKAAILDALVNGQDDEAGRTALRGRIPKSLGPDAVGALAPIVANSGGDEPAPPEVAEVLRANLPTHHCDGPGRPGDAFWLLWRLAEDAKIALGTHGTDYPIDHSDLQPVIRAIDARKIPGLPELFPLLPKENLVLSAKDFNTLMSPVLRQAAELAAWLVRTTFDQQPGDPPGQPRPRLDRVVLSGKTSRMDLLQTAVTEVLSGSGEAGRRLPWNPATLEVEFERAKQAAALGACWAQVFRERDSGGDEAELDRGRTLVTFDVENLFRSLPCGFYQLLVATETKTLLRAGTRMVEADGTGQLVARSGWERLVPTFEVHRPNGPAETIQWGVFRYYNHRDPDGFRPSPAVWGPGTGGTRGSRIMAQLEIDQGLNPYLYLCRGEPHYYVGVPPELAIELRGEFDKDCWDSGELRLRSMPAAVWVRTDSDEGRELFPVWDPATGDGIAVSFPHFFHVEKDVPSNPVRGRISEPLPQPSSDGYYEFSLHWPDGRTQDLGKPSVAGSREGTTRYVATLDARGTLRLHRGQPSYWAARSLRDVEEHAGAVRRVQMDPGIDELKPSWKPFDGKH
jgi:hypothetical protein